MPPKDTSKYLEIFLTIVGIIVGLGALIAVPIIVINNNPMNQTTIVITTTPEPTLAPIIITATNNQEQPQIITTTPLATPKPIIVTATFSPSTATSTELPSPLPTATPSMTLPFTDSFDLRALPEWEPISGTWRVIDGWYTADRGTESIVLIGDANWSNYRIEVDVRFRDWNRPVRMLVRVERGSYLALETNCCSTSWILVSNGESNVIATGENGGLRGGIGWDEVHLVVEAQDDIFTAYSDNNLLLTVQDATLDKGRVGLWINYPFDETPRYDNFTISELSSD